MEEQPSSELGTKEHWDDTYTRELGEFTRHGDLGEVWFGEESEDGVVEWLHASWPGEAPLLQRSVIDLGTGNGHFLMRLSRAGFSNLCGVDYSEHSVQLAEGIAAKEKLDIKYACADLVGTSLPACSLTEGRQYHLCHDKGTYDAVSLTPDNAARDRVLYMDNVHRLLRPDGVFIITSCNWTQDELVAHFANHFEKVHTIPTPTFMFGGKTGNMFTSLVFKKISPMDR